MIEGLGDEVTLVLGGFLVFVILLLAWLSTHTSEIPLLRGMGVIVVELTQRSNRSTPPLEAAAADSNESESNRSPPEQRSTVSVATATSVGDAEVPQVSLTSSQSQGSSAEASQPKSSMSGDQSSSRSLPEAAEALAAEMDRLHIQPHVEGSDNKETQSEITSTVEGTDTAIPQASVVVDENGKQIDAGIDPDEHPSEEEIRRRRVQYFQQTSDRHSGDGECVNNISTNHRETGSTLKTSGSCDISVTCSEQVTSSTETTLRQRLTSSLPPSDTQTDRTLPEPDSSAAENINVSPVESSPLPTCSDSSSDGVIRVKLKYMNESHRLVYAKPLDTIGDFRRANFQTELADNKWVRFIYNGQDLRDDQRTLQACSIGDNCTMHCLITAQARTPTTEPVEEDDGEDSVLGSLMYPLFTVVLLIVWYFRFMYRQYFSALSTVCLMGISFLLALSYISSVHWPDTPPTTPPQPTRHTTPPRAGGSGQQHPHTD